MSAQSYGFACHDLSWKPLPNGEIEATFTSVPLWKFENRTGELRYIPQVGGWDGIPMKRGEWMVSTGDGIGIAAAICACMKRLGLTNWLVFTDRCVLPLIHGKSSAAYGSDQFKNLQTALKNINRLAKLQTDPTTEISAIQMDGGKQNPFGPLIEWADRAIVTLYRGGDLATISRPDAVGSNPQLDETDALEQRSCGRITETLNEQVSAFVIDYVLNEPLLAEIVVEPVSKPDVKQDMEIDRFLLACGVKLSKTDALSRYGRAEAEDEADALAAPPQGNGEWVTGNGETPFRSQFPVPRSALANETPLQTRENRLQNAPRVLDGQGDPSGIPPSQIAKKRPSERSAVVDAFIRQNSEAAKAVKAVVDNPSEGAFAQLMVNLPALLPTDPALASVIADEMAKMFGEESRAEAQRRGGLANMREYKRERDGKFAEVDHPSDFNPGDNPDSAETQAAEIGKGKKAIAKCLAEKVDVPNAVSRGDVGLISLVYTTGGDNPRGMVRFLERPDAKEHLAETLVRGKAKGPYQNGQKLNLEHAGYVATLRLTGDEKAGFPRNWVLTGYGPEDKSEGGKR